MRAHISTVTGEGNAPRYHRTQAEIERMKKERYYCERCNRSHHIFQFGPSSTRKIAVCGKSFPLIKGE